MVLQKKKIIRDHVVKREKHMNRDKSKILQVVSVLGRLVLECFILPPEVYPSDKNKDIPEYGAISNRVTKAEQLGQLPQALNEKGAGKISATTKATQSHL